MKSEIGVSLRSHGGNDDLEGTERRRFARRMSASSKARQVFTGNGEQGPAVFSDGCEKCLGPILKKPTPMSVLRRAGSPVCCLTVDIGNGKSNALPRKWRCSRRSTRPVLFTGECARTNSGRPFQAPCHESPKPFRGTRSKSTPRKMTKFGEWCGRAGHGPLFLSPPYGPPVIENRARTLTCS